MDLLADSREVIRNDVSTLTFCITLYLNPFETECWVEVCLSLWHFVFCHHQGLLLLQQLTKSNAAIQKIVAFENAFERLLDIITEEGSSDGGKLIFTQNCYWTIWSYLFSLNTVGFFGGFFVFLACDMSWHLSSFLCAGIVVEDCLLLLLNLLKNNSSNQNFFKEGSYIQRMKPWFEVGDDNSGWSAQKVTNLHLMLQVIYLIVILI